MENQTNKSIRPKRMKRLFPRGSTPLGFSYSMDDEMAIEFACRKSEKWMNEQYGKGARPHRLGVGDI